jgi:hypothetical protein
MGLTESLLLALPALLAIVKLTALGAALRWVMSDSGASPGTARRGLFGAAPMTMLP